MVQWSREIMELKYQTTYQATNSDLAISFLDIDMTPLMCFIDLHLSTIMLKRSREALSEAISS